MPTSPADTTTQADRAIAFALAQQGKPYVWGATGPNAYDCSGLVQAAYKAAGVSLPRTTFTMINVGIDVPQSALSPGDLVFPDPGHVQMYLGNGQIIEAPQAGENVRVTKMWGFWKARRVTTDQGYIFSLAPKGPYEPSALKAPLTQAQRTAIIAYLRKYSSNIPEGKFGNPILEHATDEYLIQYYTSIDTHNDNVKGDPGVAVPGSNANTSLLDLVKSGADQMGKILSIVTDLSKAFTFITDPANVKRVALFIAGIILVILAVVQMQRGNITKLAKVGVLA